MLGIGTGDFFAKKRSTNVVQTNPNRSANTPHIDRARTVITRSGAIVRGKFSSRKNQRMIHYEGLLELSACYMFEMSSNIIAYREQPLKIQYADGNRLRRYIPDFKVTLKTGEIVLVEIKHSTILARIEIHHKYREISAHMQRIDQAYCIVTDTIIRQEPRLSSLRYVYGQLLRQVPTQIQLDTIASDLASHSAFLKNASIKTVNSLLKPYGVSAFDLLASGHLVCDLTLPVQESTQTSINKENRHEWFRISEELSI
ncbi:hypothetical protein CAP48_01650 [Advenella sp. S44]|nr:hypothetical protein CAP48_01650 [Advenella sp. S44]